MRVILMAVVLELATLSVGCQSDTKIPPRPVNVPATAAWAGGSDGGAFIECQIVADGFNSCKVYSDSTGEVWMHGTYALKGANRGATKSELVYSFADGRGIGLVNGGYLIPR